MAGGACDGVGRVTVPRVAQWRHWQPFSLGFLVFHDAERRAMWTASRGREEVQFLQHLDHTAPELVPHMHGGNVARQRARGAIAPPPGWRRVASHTRAAGSRLSSIAAADRVAVP
jgi:hypothetical protein